MKRWFRWHSRENLLSRFALLTILALAIGTVAFVGYAQQRPQSLSGTSRGGGVHGCISAQIKVHIGPETTGATVIRSLALPDFKVFLQNVDTGESSQPVSTDLMGRYAFPIQKPGSYQLHWKQQGDGRRAFWISRLSLQTARLIRVRPRSSRLPDRGWSRAS